MATDTETTQGVVPHWTVGDRIAKARHHARMTLRELAEPLSVTHATVSNWERDVSPPRPIFLREIARLTGVDPRWLETGATDGTARADRRADDAAPSERDVQEDRRARGSRCVSPGASRRLPVAA